MSKNFVRCLIITPAKYGHLQVPASTALMAYERKNKYYNLTCSFNLSRILTFHFLFQSRFICAQTQYLDVVGTVNYHVNIPTP